MSSQTSNPFDIPARIEKSLKEEKQDSLLFKNPFEVSHILLKKPDTKSVVIKAITNASPKVSNAFVFWILLFSWALLAIVLVSKPQIFSNIARASINENVLKLLNREENSGLNPSYILQYVVYFINASVFIYLINQFFNQVYGVKIWFFCLLGVITVYLIRHLTLFVLANVFPVEKEATIYNFTIIVFNLFIGVLLIPANLILAFGPLSLAKTTIFIIVGILGLVYIIRQLRGVVISLNFINSSIFLFFIYLCTLEIAPMMCLIRFVSKL